MRVLFFLYLRGVVSLTGLLRELSAGRVIVAIDPGKAVNRVWISSGSGLLADPMSESLVETLRAVWFPRNHGGFPMPLAVWS